MEAVIIAMNCKEILKIR